MAHIAFGSNPVAFGRNSDEIEDPYLAGFQAGAAQAARAAHAAAQAAAAASQVPHLPLGGAPTLSVANTLGHHLPSPSSPTSPFPLSAGAVGDGSHFQIPTLSTPTNPWSNVNILAANSTRMELSMFPTFPTSDEFNMLFEPNQAATIASLAESVTSTGASPSIFAFDVTTTSRSAPSLLSSNPTFSYIENFKDDDDLNMLTEHLLDTTMLGLHDIEDESQTLSSPIAPGPPSNSSSPSALGGARGENSLGLGIETATSSSPDLSNIPSDAESMSHSPPPLLPLSALSNSSRTTPPLENRTSVKRTISDTNNNNHTPVSSSESTSVRSSSATPVSVVNSSLELTWAQSDEEREPNPKRSKSVKSGPGSIGSKKTVANPLPTLVTQNLVANAHSKNKGADQPLSAGPMSATLSSTSVQAATAPLLGLFGPFALGPSSVVSPTTTSSPFAPNFPSPPVMASQLNTTQAVPDNRITFAAPRALGEVSAVSNSVAAHATSGKTTGQKQTTSRHESSDDSGETGSGKRTSKRRGRQPKAKSQPVTGTSRSQQEKAKTVTSKQPKSSQQPSLQQQQQSTTTSPSRITVAASNIQNQPKQTGSPPSSSSATVSTTPQTLTIVATTLAHPPHVPPAAPGRFLGTVPPPVPKAFPAVQSLGAIFPPAPHLLSAPPATQTQTRSPHGPTLPIPPTATSTPTVSAISAVPPKPGVAIPPIPLLGKTGPGGELKMPITRLPGSRPSPQTQIAAQIAKQQRKVAHNAIERRYRNNINDRIAELRSVVPALYLAKIKDKDGAGGGGRRTGKSNKKKGGGEDDESDDESGGEEREMADGIAIATKLNKATVLRKATEYIVHLKAGREALREENAALRELITSLPGGVEALAKFSAEQSATAAAAIYAIAGGKSPVVGESVENLDRQELSPPNSSTASSSCSTSSGSPPPSSPDTASEDEQIKTTSPASTQQAAPSSSFDPHLLSPFGLKAPQYVSPMQIDGLNSATAQMQHPSLHRQGVRMMMMMFMCACVLYAPSPFEASLYGGSNDVGVVGVVGSGTGWLGWAGLKSGVAESDPSLPVSHHEHVQAKILGDVPEDVDAMPPVITEKADEMMRKLGKQAGFGRSSVWHNMMHWIWTAGKCIVFLCCVYNFYLTFVPSPTSTQSRSKSAANGIRELQARRKKEKDADLDSEVVGPGTPHEGPLHLDARQNLARATRILSTIRSVATNPITTRATLERLYRSLFPSGFSSSALTPEKEGSDEAETLLWTTSASSKTLLLLRMPEPPSRWNPVSRIKYVRVRFPVVMDVISFFASYVARSLPIVGRTGRKYTVSSWIGKETVGLTGNSSSTNADLMKEMSVNGAENVGEVEEDDVGRVSCGWLAKTAQIMNIVNDLECYIAGSLRPLTRMDVLAKVSTLKRLETAIANLIEDLPFGNGQPSPKVTALAGDLVNLQRSMARMYLSLALRIRLSKVMNGDEERSWKWTGVDSRTLKWMSAFLWKCGLEMLKDASSVIETLQGVCDNTDQEKWLSWFTKQHASSLNAFFESDEWVDILAKQLQRAWHANSNDITNLTPISDSVSSSCVSLVTPLWLFAILFRRWQLLQVFASKDAAYVLTASPETASSEKAGMANKAADAQRRVVSVDSLVNCFENLQRDAESAEDDGAGWYATVGLVMADWARGNGDEARKHVAMAGSFLANNDTEASSEDGLESAMHGCRKVASLAMTIRLMAETGRQDAVRTLLSQFDEVVKRRREMVKQKQLQQKDGDDEDGDLGFIHNNTLENRLAKTVEFLVLTWCMPYIAGLAAGATITPICLSDSTTLPQSDTGSVVKSPRQRCIGALACVHLRALLPTALEAFANAPAASSGIIESTSWDGAEGVVGVCMRRVMEWQDVVRYHRVMS
ncbi:hypothetical protein HK102_008445 [Quaeritorhiza haematococci]|nr:hypothetical protein HK102_008445 [Quaeritorhiza haematococci]